MASISISATSNGPIKDNGKPLLLVRRVRCQNCLRTNTDNWKSSFQRKAVTAQRIRFIKARKLAA